MKISITQEDFANIMTPIGYPIISVEDLTNGTMNQEDIETQLIFPAMQDYFKFFPIKDQQEYSVGLNYDIAFPDEFTFTVLDARLIPYYATSQVSASPFMNELYIKRADQGYGGRYGTRNDYEMFPVAQLRRAEQQGLMESYRAVKVHPDLVKKTIHGYTTITGRLTITWGKYSLNFSDIPFQYNRDVIKLAQSNVLDFFGRLRQQSAASLPTDVSGDNFVERSKELREEIMERWRSYTKVAIVRG